MKRGRPLYFLVTVGLLWTGARTVMLWPAGAALPTPLDEAVPIQPALASEIVPPVFAAQPAPNGQRAVVAGTGIGGRAASPHALAPPMRHTPAQLAQADVGGGFLLTPGVPRTPEMRGGGAEAHARAGALGMQIVPQPSPIAPHRSGRSRWSMTSWLIARSGTGLGASPDAPQLGGTQGGFRVDYALSRAFGATGRIASPAAGAGREASIGVAWRPEGVPLRFVAEQRIALDRGRGGPSVGVSGGVSEIRLPANFAFESYAQAGLIFRDGTEHYADGIARATTLIAQRDKLRLDFGMGTWGGVQRGVSRFDVGPTLGARLPVSGGAVRLSLDWRQRIAGNARPGSGPAISAGADF